MCQGSWIFLQGFCLWLSHSAPPAAAWAPLTAVDAVGVVVFAAGLAIEWAADVQKTRWNAQFPSGAQRKWLASGLWAWSRHPNFFGEGLLWVGLAIVAAGGVDGGVNTALCFVSPVWSSFFLFFTSLMLLEKRIDAKFGGNPEYEAYKAATSVFVLWPPTAKAAEAAPVTPPPPAKRASRGWATRVEEGHPSGSLWSPPLVKAGSSVRI